MAHRDQAGTPALVVLAAADVSRTIHTYPHDPRTPAGYGREAAAALGLDPGQVFKTLVAEVDGHLAVAVVPVAGHLDLKALATALGGKHATMAQRPDAERATGYVAGGISPLGQKAALPTAVDETAYLYNEIYVSGGRRGLDIGLAPDDLVRLTGAVVAALARD
ncbi:MAG: Cys-tRNA(Pro) deacylase [Micrococcales bacterium]|nr:Cys-tRNA(Pro) deacylase [Micrococcales bacterium]